MSADLEVEARAGGGVLHVEVHQLVRVFVIRSPLGILGRSSRDRIERSCIRFLTLSTDIQLTGTGYRSSSGAVDLTNFVGVGYVSLTLCHVVDW